MQLLKLKLTGLKNQSSSLEIDLTIIEKKNYSKVQEVIDLENYLRISKVHGFFGMNASGKTSVARAIKLFYEFAKPQNITSIINTDEYKRVLNKTFTLESIYYNDNMIYVSKLEVSKDEIIKDVLYSTDISNIKSKSSLINIFETYTIAGINNVFIKDKEQVKQEVSAEYMGLFNQVSLIALSSDSKPEQLIDTLSLTNFNYFYMSESDEELINDIIISLDKNIEKIEITDETEEVQIKFINGRTINTNTSDCFHYLSSGTIRGLLLFTRMFKVFKTGGVFIVDEIETHINRTLVNEMIRMFKSEEINHKNAILYFTSHTVELLDTFELQENIHIINNTEDIYVKKLNEYSPRQDLKLSKSYLAGKFDSMPSYNQLKALRKGFKK